MQAWFPVLPDCGKRPLTNVAMAVPGSRFGRLFTGLPCFQFIVPIPTSPGTFVLIKVTHSASPTCGLPARAASGNRNDKFAPSPHHCSALQYWRPSREAMLRKIKILCGCVHGVVFGMCGWYCRAHTWKALPHHESMAQKEKAAGVRLLLQGHAVIKLPFRYVNSPTQPHLNDYFDLYVFDSLVFCGGGGGNRTRGKPRKNAGLER